MLTKQQATIVSQNTFHFLQSRQRIRNAAQRKRHNDSVKAASISVYTTHIHRNHIDRYTDTGSALSGSRLHLRSGINASHTGDPRLIVVSEI